MDARRTAPFVLGALAFFVTLLALAGGTSAPADAGFGPPPMAWDDTWSPEWAPEPVARVVHVVATPVVQTGRCVTRCVQRCVVRPVNDGCRAVANQCWPSSSRGWGWRWRRCR